MVFMGRGFISREKESGSVFGVVMAKKCYIESLPSVLKDKEAASLKVKGPLYSCLLIARLPSGSIRCLIEIIDL